MTKEFLQSTIAVEKQLLNKILEDKEKVFGVYDRLIEMKKTSAG